MRLAWLTDIHLNFLEKSEREIFYKTIIHGEYDNLLITGDIAEATSIVEILEEMAAYIQIPIYFVLGNHDYYSGKIDQVRGEMITLTQKNKRVNWLPAIAFHPLNKDVILLGQDGWADGRLGNYASSHVVLNDSRLITDLFQHKLLSKSALLKKMQQLADDDANVLRKNLIEAIHKYNPSKIILLTHVPPFKEACLYQNKQSGNDYLPFFSSKATGNVLTQFAEEYSDIQFLIYCGHTHHNAFYKPLENLEVHVGDADYYNPKIQKVITI